MAKVVDIEALKPIIEPLLNDENTASTIESILSVSTEVDEAANEAKIAEAVAAAKAEEAAIYAQKLKDMFFGTGNTEPENNEDQNINDEETPEVPNIFDEI